MRNLRTKFPRFSCIPQTPGLQNCINACCLNQPVCGVLLERPRHRAHVYRWSPTYCGSIKQIFDFTMVWKWCTFIVCILFLPQRASPNTFKFPGLKTGYHTVMSFAFLMTQVMFFLFLMTQMERSMMLVLFKESWPLRNSSIIRIYSPQMEQTFLGYGW